MKHLKIIEHHMGKGQIIVNANDAEFADKVMWARKKKGPWEVIDLLVSEWVKRSPEEFKAFKVTIKEDRETLADPKFGQTKGGKDQERRWIGLMPLMLQNLIRTQYSNSELPFTRTFFKKFYKKYPFFQIPEKL